MSATRRQEFTGRHMLLVITAFFAVIIGVNFFMAYLASRTWTGLVVENSYVASQEFQAKADAAQAQNAAGWTMNVAYHGSTLEVQLLAAGKPLDVTGVSAFLRRPVGGHDDVMVPLTAGPLGYEAIVELAPGVWDVTVTTDETPLGAIERETRISVP